MILDVEESTTLGCVVDALGNIRPHFKARTVDLGQVNGGYRGEGGGFTGHLAIGCLRSRVKIDILTGILEIVNT